jgi:Glutamine amidotransferases class-II
VCRYYGLRATRPTRVDWHLVGAPNSLLVQSRRDLSGFEHADGWGIAAYDGDIVQVQRRAAAAHDGHYFCEAAARVEATTVLAHVRRATVGRIGLANTHPFVHGRFARFPARPGALGCGPAVTCTGGRPCARRARSRGSRPGAAGSRSLGSTAGSAILPASDRRWRRAGASSRSPARPPRWPSCERRRRAPADRSEGCGGSWRAGPRAPGWRRRSGPGLGVGSDRMSRRPWE